MKYSVAFFLTSLFHHKGEYLYEAGGYGYSATVDDDITYSNLTAIHIPEVMNEIIQGAISETGIAQIEDSDLAVSGARLERKDGMYYLCG